MILATIPHSGTFNTITLLGRKVCPLNEPESFQAGMLMFTHLEDTAMPLIEARVGTMPILTTYRPVEHIRASWLRLGENLDELEMNLRNYARLLEWHPYVLHLGRR